MQRRGDDENYENPYEHAMRYENSEVTMSSRPLPSINQPVDSKTKIKGQENSAVNNLPNMKAVLMGFGLITIALLATVLVQLNIALTKTNTSNILNNNNQQQVTQSPKSCYELKQLGIKIDGIYSIKPENDFMQFSTFCDMETDGGGWTLVASVHESDITQKCDAEDRWASYVPEKYIVFAEKTNWENKKVFGDVSKCTEDDYKNSAYYSLNANDVMVWHVPSSAPIAAMKEKASSRYRTTNHFLQNNGGNLQKMFEERYPLKVNPGTI